MIPDRPHRFLGIGEVYASATGETLVCRGLGSCVGVFLYDRQQKLGGGAHIFLPERIDTAQLSDTHFAHGAMETLLHEVVALGGNPRGLRAYVYGGAQLFTQGLDTGARNVATVRHWLTQQYIFLAHQQVGGDQPQSVQFCTRQGVAQPIYHSHTKHNSVWPNVS